MPTTIRHDLTCQDCGGTDFQQRYYNGSSQAQCRWCHAVHSPNLDEIAAAARDIKRENMRDMRGKGPTHEPRRGKRKRRTGRL